MAEISRFFEIIIRMYWPVHNPPHFHAYYSEHEAVYNIKTGERMVGRMPKKGETNHSRLV